MTDERTAAESRHWSAGPSAKVSFTPTSEAWRRPHADTALTRFLGGSPANVFLRLFFLSLIIGALMMWLDIRPADVIEMVTSFFRRVWAMGFDALREFGDYLLAGAVIVVPIWLVSRLFSMGRSR
jgi:hypothetical protein